MYYSLVHITAELAIFKQYNKYTKYEVNDNIKVCKKKSHISHKGQKFVRIHVIYAIWSLLCILRYDFKVVLYAVMKLWFIILILEDYAVQFHGF
jgi:hypothetical protein